eukprot:3641077-Alexandrium_andersonii.AAC.1
MARMLRKTAVERQAANAVLVQPRAFAALGGAHQLARRCAKAHHRWRKQRCRRALTARATRGQCSEGGACCTRP